MGAAPVRTLRIKEANPRPGAEVEPLEGARGTLPQYFQHCAYPPPPPQPQSSVLGQVPLTLQGELPAFIAGKPPALASSIKEGWPTCQFSFLPWYPRVPSGAHQLDSLLDPCFRILEGSLEVA